MASWSAFDEFDGICDQYLPSRGEGDTMASQIVTAINKLIYKKLDRKIPPFRVGYKLTRHTIYFIQNTNN